ncbi:hypothetical protein Tco_0450485 [Tanacetum coccineum]
MNGWLIKDEDEPLEHEASDKEVDSDLESTASKMAPSRRSGPSNNEENPDITAIIAQQLQTILPQIVTQVTNNVNNANGGNGGNGGNNGYTYKGFMACNPKEYDGKGMDREDEEFQERGREAAIGFSLTDFKALLVEEFCPSNEIEKLESEFWNHKMVGANHAGYTDRFHESAKLVPHLVTPESSPIKRRSLVCKTSGHIDIVMLNLEDSTVTYTAVSSPFEDLSDIGSPGVDGLPMMLEDPYVEAAL